MANISSLLEIIRTAHLGRDMRQALHDAIEDVNDDTETALGKTLAFNDTTRKLTLKAKDNTVLSEATIPGGSSGSTVSWNQIKQSGEKIATITIDNTSTDVYASAGGGGGGGAVDSVNGKTGDVVLTASDVGALADNTPIPSNLSDLSDVATSSPTNGQLLGYNSTTNKWTNVNAPSGGGGSNENLLLNPWFRVNSGGFSSGSGASITNKQIIDGWKCNAISPSTNAIALSSGALTFTLASQSGTSYIEMRQTFKTTLQNGTYTVSFMLSDGTVYSGNLTFSGSQVSKRVNLSGNTYCNVDISTSMFNSIFATPSGTSATISVKAIKLELGATSTLSLDTAPNYNEDLMKLGYINGNSNRNLLDNAWFTVNQKGVTSGDFTINGKYFDRWVTAYGGSPSGSYASWTLSDGILTFDARNTAYVPYFANYLENNLEVGKQYTMSIMYEDNTVNSLTFVAKSSGYKIGNYVNGVAPSMLFNTPNNFFMIRGSSNAYAKIKAVKLEVGGVSTLAFDTAPDYTTELLKCQRYFYRITSATQCYIGMAGNTSTNLAYWFVNLPTPMRTAPTISTGGTIKLIKGTTEVVVTSIARGSSGVSDIVPIYITSSSALDLDSLYLVQILGNSYIDFDAQL